MNQIEPWCISRQIWWGHRIPAWYDDEKNIYVAENEKEALLLAKKKSKKKIINLNQQDVNIFLENVYIAKNRKIMNMTFL